MNRVLPLFRTGVLSRLVLLVLASALAAAAAAWPTPASAASPPTALSRPQPIPLAACVARQAKGDTPQALFAAPQSLAKRFDCQTRQYRFGPGDYWLRLALPAAIGPTAPARFLSFIPFWQQDATLYARHADGSISTFRLDNHSLTTLTRIGAQVQLPISGPISGPASGNPSPVTALLLRLDGAINGTGLTGAITLVDEPAGDRQEVLETAIYAGFAGLCLALFVYNIVLWLAARERFQLVYCLTLLSMQFYGLSNSGAWSLFFPDGDITDRFRLGYASLGLVAVLALRFFADFIEPDALPARLKQAALGVRLLLAAVSLGMALAPAAALPILDRIYAASFLGVPLLTLTLAVVALRNGSRSARVLLAAWALPCTIIVYRLCHSLNLLESSALANHAAVMAMSVQALLSSLAMALRIKQITEERDTARADERMARLLADVDPLTGLLNRRGLLDSTLAWQSREPLRLLLIDIDHFKLVNDTYGHDLGDGVLSELASVLARRAELRASIGRLGGEEFALIGTASELSPAMALALLADVRNTSFGNGIKITVSIGMAQGPVSNETDWLELYRQADMALYAAKAAGRNRMVDGGQANQLLPRQTESAPLPQRA